MTSILWSVVLAGSIAGGALAAAPLGPPPPSGTRLPEGQCIILRDAGPHRVVDKNTLLMGSTGKNRGVYRFTMTNGCLMSAISSDPLGMSQVSHGGTICAPRDVSLHARGGLCAIDSIVKLTPDEFRSLPRQLKP